jgi:hypothetical protein
MGIKPDEEHLKWNTKAKALQTRRSHLTGMSLSIADLTTVNLYMRGTPPKLSNNLKIVSDSNHDLNHLGA